MQNTKTAQEKLNLITSKELSSILGIDSNVVNQSRCTGILLGAPAPKHLKLGRLIRYRKQIISEWIKKFENNQTKSPNVA